MFKFLRPSVVLLSLLILVAETMAGDSSPCPGKIIVAVATHDLKPMEMPECLSASDLSSAGQMEKNRMVARGKDGSFLIWNSATGKLLTWEKKRGPFVSIHIQDGQAIAKRADGRTVVFSMETGSVVESSPENDTKPDGGTAAPAR